MIPPAASRRLSHSEHNLFPKFWVTLSQLLPMPRRGGIPIQRPAIAFMRGVRRMPSLVRIPPLVRIPLVAAVKSGPSREL
jgi:hypothetical protein